MAQGGACAFVANSMRRGGATLGERSAFLAEEDAAATVHLMRTGDGDDSKHQMARDPRDPHIAHTTSSQLTS